MDDGIVVELKGYFEGPDPRRLFLETADDRLVLVDTSGAVTDGPLQLNFIPEPTRSPFVSLTESRGAGAGAGALLGGPGAAAALAARAQVAAERRPCAAGGPVCDAVLCRALNGQIGLSPTRVEGCADPPHAKLVNFRSHHDGLSL